MDLSMQTRVGSSLKYSGYSLSLFFSLYISLFSETSNINIMLTNKKLLIDKDCPMCGFYGAAFTKMGLIDSRTIQPYQTVDRKLYKNIDMDRARNAIALHGEAGTVYGIDAFIEILSQGKKAIKEVLRFPLIYYPLLALYNLISYNRKLIYPVANAPGKTCIPDVNLTYRWIYIFLVAIITGLVLNNFGSRVMHQLGVIHHPHVEWIMCFGQIVWQGAAVLLLRKERAMDYLGNMSTVSLIGGFLVGFILLLGQAVNIQPWLYLALFAVVVTIMLIEHIRRCSLLNLPWKMTLSWIVFRTIFLLVILHKIGVL